MAGKRTSVGGSTASTPNKTSTPPQAISRPVAGQVPASAASQPKVERAPLSEVKTQPKHEDIARAAYLRWLRDGGDPATNWLAAEAELTGRAALKL